MPDVIVVGGGVIGLSCAWELARHGRSVTVLDQATMGREASWAGAGMIPPGDTAGAAPNRLAVMSSKLWPVLSAQLLEQTGIDNGYRPCQGILVPAESEFDSEENAWRSCGVPVERIDDKRLQEQLPALNREIRQALLLPSQAQVRNPRHLKALLAACRESGVQLLEFTQVTGWKRSGNRIVAVETEQGTQSGDEFIVASGAWSDSVVAPLPMTLGIRPLRGQIALLKTPVPLFRQTIECGRRYLVPRDDGRVLVGATEEDVGFRKANTPEAVDSLIRFAHKLIPGLSESVLETTWSGLRPFRERRVPVISRPSDWSNLTLAAGHFRAGLSNSPATAVLVRQLLSDEAPALDLSPFAAASV